MADIVSQDDLNALFEGVSLSVKNEVPVPAVAIEAARDNRPECLSQDDIDRLLEAYGK